jgi:hypothetical protein
MRSILLGAVAAVGLWPAVASAVVTVRPADQVGRPGETVPVEVYADPLTLTPDANEQLNAYTMTMSAITFAGANDPSFVVPANFTFEINTDATHQYVFTAADPPFDPTSGSDRKLVFLSAAPGTASTNLDAVRNGFGKVMVSIPQGAQPGIYTMRIDNDFLSLGGATGTIDAIGGTGTFTVVPEPASLGLVAIGGLLALRRRRTA